MAAFLGCAPRGGRRFGDRRLRAWRLRRRHRSRRRGLDPGQRLRGGRRGTRRRRRTAGTGRRPPRRSRPDPEALDRAIGPRTRGILVVHLYGLPVEMAPLLGLAREHGLVVIEDCSHAHGATLDGRARWARSASPARSAWAWSRTSPPTATPASSAPTTERARGARRAARQTRPGAEERARPLRRQQPPRRAACRDAARQAAHARARNDRRAAIAAYYSSRLARSRRSCRRPTRAAPTCTISTSFALRSGMRCGATWRRREIETGIHYPVPIHRQPAWRERVRRGAAPAAGRARGRGDSLPARAPRPDRRRGRARGGQRRGLLRLMERSTPTDALDRRARPRRGGERRPAARRAHRRAQTPRTAVRADLRERRQPRPHARSASRRSRPRPRTCASSIWTATSARRRRCRPGSTRRAAHVVVTLDGDGQNDPHDIPKLLARLDEGYDAVSGRRVAREEAFADRVLPSRVANRLIALVDAACPCTTAAAASRPTAARSSPARSCRAA